MVADRKSIVEKTDLEEEDLGGFPVNSPDCMVLDQSINNTWKNLKYGGLNEKVPEKKAVSSNQWWFHQRFLLKLRRDENTAYSKCN